MLSRPGASPITAVVFDLGGVVVQWDMRALFRHFFDDETDIDRFLTEVLTPAENLRCDLGTPLATVVSELIELHPADRAPLEGWRDRWIETIPAEIPGTAALIDELRAAGYGVFGLSNFSAETFPWCRDRYPVIGQFDDMVISGEVGFAKPQPEVYGLLCARNGLEPSQAVFLDDSPVNVEGARAVGMASFVFTTADQARRDLRSIGVSA